MAGPSDATKGYDSSTCESADAPNYPGNQSWEGVGGMAEKYKAHWKNKPRAYPYGTNDEGGK